MEKRSIFVHSGMAEKDGKGVLLTGTGGCGKTSTMMDLVGNSGYRYMSEDFGILTNDGKMYDMQKCATIYQSDINWGAPVLSRLVKRMCLTDKYEWKLKNLIKRNPMHSFKPSDIFNENIAHKADLTCAFYLKRTAGKAKLNVQNITAEQLAERMKNASFRELKILYELLCNIRAVGGDNYYKDFPTVDYLEKKYVNIAFSSVKNVSCYEISIPFNTNPHNIAHLINSCL